MLVGLSTYIYRIVQSCMSRRGSLLMYVHIRFAFPGYKVIKNTQFFLPNIVQNYIARYIHYTLNKDSM